MYMFVREDCYVVNINIIEATGTLAYESVVYCESERNYLKLAALKDTNIKT